MADLIMNFNQSIKAELTDSGYKLWKEHDDSYLPIEFRKPIEEYKKRADIFGVTEFQLWDFMNIFGKHMKLGMGNPITKGNNIIL